MPFEDFLKNINPQEVGMGIADIVGAVEQMKTGRPNPIPGMRKAKQDTLDQQLQRQLAERKLRTDETRLGLEQERVGLDRQRFDRDTEIQNAGEIEKIVKVLIASGADDKISTNALRGWIKSSPNLMKTFGDDIDSLSVDPAGKAPIKRDDYVVRKGDKIKDPVTGELLAEGTRWDLTGTFKGGEWKLSELNPSAREIAEKKDIEKERLAADREDRRDIRTEKAEAGREQRSLRSQEGSDRRLEQTLQAFQQKPMDASIQTSMATFDEIDRQIGVIETNFDKQFLGPVKGTDTAFETRRTIGNYLNAPLGRRETIFRQSLKDINDQILRARSGAMINEQEAARLRGMLPKATDEETVFKAGIERFRESVREVRAAKIRMSTTPRGQLEGAPVTAPSTPASGGSGERKSVGGKTYERRNGQWFEVR